MDTASCSAECATQRYARGAAAIIGVEQRAPFRPQHLLMLVGLPGHRDHFVVPFERAPAVGRQVPARPGGIDVEQDDVAPVGVGVGESPRDVRVAADDDGRDARERDADQRGCGSFGFDGSGHSSAARYQVFGTRIVRCMSLATSAPPSAVSRPDTAKLLLPTARAHSLSSIPAPNPARSRRDRRRSWDGSAACRCAARAGRRRRDPGSAASVNASPIDRRVPFRSAGRHERIHRQAAAPSAIVASVDS